MQSKVRFEIVSGLYCDFLNCLVENGFYINEIPQGSLGDVSYDRHMREIPYPEAEKITFFIYEEMLSCKRACQTLGLTKDDVNKIFYANAAKLFGVE